MSRRIVIIPAVLVALAAAFLAGFALASSGGGDPAAGGGRGNVLDEVIRRLETDFIHRNDLSLDDLRQAAVQGVIDFIDDPYTAYLSPERHAAFLQELEGIVEDFEGIGASVTYDQGAIVILGPLPGSPAERADIQPGDVVLAVDGRSVSGTTLDEAVALIRGPRNTTVVLTVSRFGASAPIDVEIVRDTITVSTVLPRMQNAGVGYVRLASFDATTEPEFRSALEELRERGARGLILDLRNNGGGTVPAAVAVVSEFVESGEVVRWVDADGNEAVEVVTGEGSAYDLPLVVIVNGFSASASEIVAGALQDHDRAVVVGTRTYGKGSVNLLHGLDSGGGLYVTFARWVTPAGREIEGAGLEPDVQVGEPLDVQAMAHVGELTRELCDAYLDKRDGFGGQERLVAALDGLCNLEAPSPSSGERDEQLEAAVAEIERMLEG